MFCTKVEAKKRSTSTVCINIHYIIQIIDEFDIDAQESTEAKEIDQKASGDAFVDDCDSEKNEEESKDVKTQKLSVVSDADNEMNTSAQPSSVGAEQLNLTVCAECDLKGATVMCTGCTGSWHEDCLTDVELGRMQSTGEQFVCGECDPDDVVIVKQKPPAVARSFRTDTVCTKH